MAEKVGVVAIQGDFERHLEALARAGSLGIEVRTVDDLGKVDRLILPGGESTTVGLLMQRYGLGEAIQHAAQAGMPIWGTCMGMILMAREIENRPEQYRLGVLDVAVRRNAFGAQVHSFEEEIPVDGLDEPFMGVFIRAPVVTQTGPEVEVLSRVEGGIVAVRQGRRLGTAFHPEMTEDPRLHELFLRL